MCPFLNTTIINLLSQIFVMYLTVWLHDHFVCFSFALGTWKPPSAEARHHQSSRLSFVHVLIAVRDCQVDSITNMAMPCRLSINDVDQRCRSTMSINDVDQRCRSTMSINDVDQRCRSTMSINDVDQRCRSTMSINDVDQRCRSTMSINDVDHGF